ncbi:MAG: Ger(x)C family spore germination protein [Syntrophomonadaceae bacterium]
MQKRIGLVLLILLLVISQAGCWDADEINELGFVLCVALDRSGNEYKVTTQIAKPETYSKTPSGGSQPKQQQPFWVISATGKTIFEAIRNLANISPRRIFWAHIKVIIIGEELARHNIHDVLDFFSRNPELRLRTLIAVTPGEAGKLLDIIPIMEKDPATDLERIIENRNLSGKGYRIMLKNFLEDYLEPNGNPVASRVILCKSEGTPVIKLNGAAVFRKNKMVGWLNEKETRGLLWVENEINNTLMVINCPYDNKPVTVELNSGKTSLKSRIQNGIPYYEINTQTTANVVEQECATNFIDPARLHKLEKTLASAINQDIQSTVIAVQNLGVDFLGLNEILHRQNTKEWKQLSGNWSEVLNQIKFDFSTKAEIPSVSVLAKPLAPAEKVR